MKIKPTKLLFVTVAALGLSFAANAQVMSKPEYLAFVKRLDADIPNWQRLIKGLNVENLQVSYAVGKMIVEHQQVATENLDVVKRNITLELLRPRLSN
ncbi:MAG: hypothetical protein ABSH02_04995 [Candidatus Sulfotelmatobacter sp.]|jgi:hypothetical protein